MHGPTELGAALRRAVGEGWLDPARAERLLAGAGSCPPGQEAAWLRGAGLDESQIQRLLAPRSPAPRVEDGPPLQAVLRAGPFGSSRAAGARLGPWRVERELGRGAMGVVFLARHLETGEQAALKVLIAGEVAGERPRRRLEREVEALRALSHPALVRVVEGGTLDGTPYLAMEYVPGANLAERMGQLSPRALVEIVARVARGLEQAHLAGIVHRDVKPANILIRDGDGQPFLSDFGLARDLNQGSSLTQSGTTVGTPVYMAPEQVAARPPTAATDVYALGVILYQALTGQLPFAPQGLVQLYDQILHAAPPAPHLHRHDVPPELERICLRALSKDPAQRQPHAGALAGELEAWLQRPAAPPPRARGPLALGVGVLALGSLIAAAVLVRDRAPSPPPPPPQEGGGAVPAPPAPAPTAEHTLVLQPGPVEGRDTTIRNDGLYANDNLGAYSQLLIGDRDRQRGDLRALLQFDLAPIPRGARLLEARLELYQLDTEEHDAPLTVLARRVVPSGARTPWLEGASQRDARLDGVAWDGDLADGPLGDDPRVRSRRPELSQPDYDDDPGPPRATLPAGSGQAWLALDVTPLVRAWLDGAENLGLCLAHDPEGPPWQDGVHRFASSDHPRPDLRPRLTVRYRGAAPGPIPDPADAARDGELRARAALAGCDLLGDDPERLYRRAEEALALAPHSGKAFFVRGLAQCRLGEFHGGLVDLETAESCAAPYREAPLRVWRGRAQLELGRPTEAAADLEAAAAAAPEDRELRALALLARLDASGQPPGEAEMAGLRAARGTPWARLLLDSRLFQALGNHEEALKWAARAVEAEALAARDGWPRSALPLAAVGELSPPSEARVALARALALVPDSPVALEVLRRRSGQGR